MVFRNSQIWTMSTEELVEHLKSITAPDRVYWDARELKKEGKKFQSLAWSNFRRCVKTDGVWGFETDVQS